jgi:8-oxo-dGTP pyrophosphatase MutT (NUDIX family)
MEPQHVLPPDLTLARIERCLGGYCARATSAVPAHYRAAAVLIPLLQREDGLHVLFTQRTPHLSTHGGQVSFPGGGIDPCDANPVAAALREAREEIGLDPARARIIGRLDDYPTVTGFHVSPVVAVVEPQDWTPDAFEVESIFEVPLAHIAQPGILELTEQVIDDVPRRFHAMRWQDFYIWGATAGMLRNLLDVVAHGGV